MQNCRNHLQIKSVLNEEYLDGKHDGESDEGAVVVVDVDLSGGGR